MRKTDVINVFTLERDGYTVLKTEGKSTFYLKGNLIFEVTDRNTIPTAYYVSTKDMKNIYLGKFPTFTEANDASSKYLKSMKKFTKVVRKGTKNYPTCVQVYANNYSSKLDHIMEMVDILKQDFQLSNADISVQKYGGERLKGVTFVEAFINHTIEIPEDYSIINQIEYIL